jgi:hypothetical protein
MLWSSGSQSSVVCGMSHVKVAFTAMTNTAHKAVLEMPNLSVKIILNHTITTHNTFEEKGYKC